MTQSRAKLHIRRPRRALFFGLLLLGLAYIAPSSSVLGAALIPRTLDSSSQTNVSTPADDLDAQRRTIEARLAKAQADLAAAVAQGQQAITSAPTASVPQELSTRRASLQRLVRLYEQQLSESAALEKSKARKAEVARQAQVWSHFAEPPPYSILLTDRLREEVHAERQKMANAEAAAEALQQLIDENRAVLNQAEERIRQLNEQLERAKEPALNQRLAWQRDQESLRSQVAAATVAVLDLERLVGKESMAESSTRLGLLSQQLVITEAAASFTQADLDQITGQIEREQEQLERELAQTQPGRASALQLFEAARKDLREAQDRGEDSAAISLRMERLSACEAQVDLADTSAYVLRLLLEGASIERTLWELRFASYGSHNVETITDSERRLKGFSRRLELWREYAREQLAGSSAQLHLQESRVNALATDSSIFPLAKERLQALRERDQMLLRLVRSAERTERLTQRWREGLREAEDRLPFIGRVQSLFSDANSFLRRLWSFEVFTAEDTITVDGQQISGKRSVTIGKILMAIIILVVGYWITGVLTAFLEPMIVTRLKIEQNQANLIRRWLRVLLIACLVLFSLVSVKIPLTVFAFAGGALAIGLGFGLQTMLKNFVSGLILLFERPFRVGDVLDVGGQQGTVTSIGLRASVLQLWDGTETLIPNSSLLENNVSNWTYSNRKVRFSVGVGVAYGSDPRLVIQLLNEAAERHGLVEKDPKPLVLFTGFGESALQFELRFWADVSKVNSAQLASDLRLIIAGTFAERKVVIAYPQRDIHFHAAHPLPVELMNRPQQPETGNSANSASSEANQGTP